MNIRKFERFFYFILFFQPKQGDIGKKMQEVTWSEIEWQDFSDDTGGKDNIGTGFGKTEDGDWSCI